MQSRSEAIEVLLDEIRQCKDCRPERQMTPAVYSAPKPSIMVISEMPPKRAWGDDMGGQWMRKNSIKNKGWESGTKYEFCKWLGIVEEVDQLVFWMERANCYVGKGRRQVYRHCSGKFVPRAIQAVRPKLVITLGRNAARHFLPSGKLSEVVGRTFDRREGSVEYTLIPMFHPSRANIAARTEFEEKHDESIRLAKQFIDDVKQTSFPS